MEISIRDLPESKFYVKLNKEFVYHVKNLLKIKVGSWRKFYLKKNISAKGFYGWFERHLFPLSVIKEICHITETPLKVLQDNIIEVRSGRYPTRGGNLSMPIYPKFPIVLSPQLARLMAHIFCDGCLSEKSSGYYSLYYYNQSKDLREGFKSDAISIFGNLHIHEAINKNTEYIYLPVPVSLIMLNLVQTFNSQICSIPDSIQNAGKEIRKEFLKAVVDDEASVDIDEKRIEIATCNKLFTNQIKGMFEDLGIRTSIISEKITKRNGKNYFCYYFYIRKYYNLQKFFNLIRFNHPEKQRDLQILLNSYKRIPKVN